MGWKWKLHDTLRSAARLVRHHGRRYGGRLTTQRFSIEDGRGGLTLADNGRGARDGRQRISPGVFILDDPGIHIIAFVWGATPIVFIIIRFLDIQFVAQELSDEIVAIISAVWPSMKPQYEFIKQFRPSSDATNYSLFYLLMLIQILVAAAYVVKKFKDTSVPICRPGRGEFIVVSSGLVASCYVLFGDPVPATPRPFYFRVDSIGFYYIRQWMGATAIWMTVVFALASLLRLLGHYKLGRR